VTFNNNTSPGKPLAYTDNRADLIRIAGAFKNAAKGETPVSLAAAPGFLFQDLARRGKLN
jgi:hypothetical protein